MISLENIRNLRVYNLRTLEVESVTEKHQKRVTKGVRKELQKVLF